MEFVQALLSLLGSIPTAWLALIGALFGGTALKLTEHFLTRGATEDKMARDFRDEIRLDREETRAELRRVEEENDKLKESYWKLKEDYYALLADSKTQEYKVNKVAKVVDEHVETDELKDIADLPKTPDIT